VSITFDSVVTMCSFTVIHRPSGLPWAGLYATADGITWTFTPTLPFQDSAYYDVTVSTDCQDRCAATTSWSFQVDGGA
jgi:hypothetical protein